MRISKTIETPEGSIEFSGEISQEEHDMILTVGLNYLMAAGALPMKAMDVPASAVSGNDTQQ